MVLRSSSLAKKEALLSVASKSFLEKGFTAVSIDELVASVGQSKTNVYSWFGGKGGLFIASVERATQSLVNHLFVDISALDVEPALRLLARQLMQIVLDHRALALHRLVIAESPHFPEATSAWLTAGPKKACGYIAEVLLHFQRRGQLRHFEPLTGARFFHAVIVADLEALMLVGVLEPISEEAMTQRIDRAMAFFLSGYGAASS